MKVQISEALQIQINNYVSTAHAVLYAVMNNAGNVAEFKANQKAALEALQKAGMIEGLSEKDLTKLIKKASAKMPFIA